MIVTRTGVNPGKKVELVGLLTRLSVLIHNPEVLTAVSVLEKPSLATWLSESRTQAKDTPRFIFPGRQKARSCHRNSRRARKHTT
jgi:hypothetical protein